MERASHHGARGGRRPAEESLLVLKCFEIITLDVRGGHRELTIDEVFDGTRRYRLGDTCIGYSNETVPISRSATTAMGRTITFGCGFSLRRSSRCATNCGTGSNAQNYIRALPG